MSDDETLRASDPTRNKDIIDEFAAALVALFGSHACAVAEIQLEADEGAVRATWIAILQRLRRT